MKSILRILELEVADDFAGVRHESAVRVKNQVGGECVNGAFGLLRLKHRLSLRHRQNDLLLLRLVFDFELLLRLLKDRQDLLLLLWLKLLLQHWRLTGLDRWRLCRSFWRLFVCFMLRFFCY